MHAKSQFHIPVVSTTTLPTLYIYMHILRVCGQSRLCVSLTQSAESCVPSGACIASTVLPAGRRITMYMLMYMLSIARPMIRIYIHVHNYTHSASLTERGSS